MEAQGRGYGAMNVIDELLGRSLGRLRVARGLSAEMLGARARLSAATVARFEAGTERATAAELFRLAEALDIPVEGFFDGGADDAFRTDPAGTPEWPEAQDLVAHYDSLSASHRAVAFAFLVAMNRHSDETCPAPD